VTRLSGAATLLVLGLAVAGCGGDGESEEPSTVTQTVEEQSGALTKAEFIQRADAICQAGHEEGEPLVAEFQEAQQAGDAAKAADLLRQAADVADEEAGELRDLEPPPADADILDDYISAGETTIQTGRDLADAIDAGDTQAVQVLSDRFNEQTSTTQGIAQGYGFKVCGQGL
jgi:hypothetical protein